MAVSAEHAQILNKIYRDQTSKAYMGSMGHVYREAHAVDNTITLPSVKRWMLAQDSYALAPPIKYKQPHEKIISYHVDDLMSADLAEMQDYKRFNDGVRYILVLRNCFTKQVAIGYLQNKTGEHTATVFDYMLRTQVKYVCKTMVTDRGAEFLNQPFLGVCAKYNIKMYHPNTGKAWHAENAILMLKTKIYRHFRDQQTKRYIEMLPNVVKHYNTSIRSVLGVAPNDVNRTNEYALFHRQYGKNLIPQHLIKAKFDIGEHVRIRLPSRIFEKSYEPKFTVQVYKIINVLKYSNPPKYDLEAVNDSSNTLRSRERDLQLVPQNIPHQQDHNAPQTPPASPIQEPTPLTPRIRRPPSRYGF